MRRLPLVFAVVAFVLYCATLNHWVSVQSLPVLSQVAGWNDEIPLFQPVLYLITRPLVLLPSAILPIASNVFTAALAAALVAVLARCVQLLPHDRTHSQRIRGHTDGRLLDIPLAWVPPLFAAGLFALQMTVWEHATSMTGEVVHGLVFALCILCLLEFRTSGRENWLNAFAVLLGLGIANDWAMAGFAPLFVGALFWVGGWEMLRLGRLLRLAALGCAGLLLFFLMPVVAHGKTGMPADVLGVLGVQFQTYKAYLGSLPKGRFVLLAAVMLLPLLLAGVRWASPRGSGVERLMTQFFVTFLQVVWLGANVWFALDGVVSPRALVTLAPGYGGIPLLTFHFAGALAVGYLAGYFLLLGTVKPDNRWVRDGAVLAPLARAFAGLVTVVGVGVPVLLAYRNFPGITAQNGPILSDLAGSIAESLPKSPALVVTEDAFLEAVLRAQFQRQPGAPAHLVIHTRKAPDIAYRRHLARLHGAQWPDLQAVADSTENIGGVFLLFLNKASFEGKAFYLNPAVTFITEQNQLRPRGLIYQVVPYPKNQVLPSPLSAEEVAGVDAFWKAHAPQVARLSGGRQRVPAGDYAATIWSRAANWSGVELQRNQQLEAAARLFTLATNLVQDNAPAAVNAAVNERLRARQPVDAAVRKPIETYGVSIVDAYGPVDEPRFLEQLGDAVLTLGDPLIRASAQAFARARQLDPSSLEAAIGYARACMAADEPNLTLEALAPARQLAARQKPTPAQQSQLARTEANARIRLGRTAEAEAILAEALRELPADVPLLDLLTVLHLQAEQPQKALPLVDRMLKIKPEDEALLERKGYLLLQSGQFDAAIKVIGDLLARRPDANAARMNRATAHLLAGHLDAARDDFEEVLRKMPTAADAMVGLAQVAEMRKDKPEVVRMLEKAIDLLPANAALRSNLVQRVKTLKAAP